MKLFIVGKYIKQTESGAAWEMQGVFDSKAWAIKNCKDHNYFIGPVELNRPFPHETVEWPDCYYPFSR